MHRYCFLKVYNLYLLSPRAKNPLTMTGRPDFVEGKTGRGSITDTRSWNSSPLESDKQTATVTSAFTFKMLAISWSLSLFVPGSRSFAERVSTWNLVCRPLSSTICISSPSCSRFASHLRSSFLVSFGSSSIRILFTLLRKRREAVTSCLRSANRFSLTRLEKTNQNAADQVTHSIITCSCRGFPKLAGWGTPCCATAIGTRCQQCALL